MEGFIAVMLIIAGVALWLMLKEYELKRVTQPVAKPSKQVEEICNRSAKQLGYPCYQRTVGVDSISVDTIHGLWHCDYTYNTYDRIFVGTAASLVSYTLEETFTTTSNAASRALVGGFLAGTPGAIAGAASAKKRVHSSGYQLIVTASDPKVGTQSWTCNLIQGRALIDAFDKICGRANNG